MTWTWRFAEFRVQTRSRTSDSGFDVSMCLTSALPVPSLRWTPMVKGGGGQRHAKGPWSTSLLFTLVPVFMYSVIAGLIK